MSAYRRSNITRDRAIGAGVNDPIFLGVDPASFYLLTLKALNNVVDPVAVNTIENFFGFITRLELRFKGATVIGGSLADIARMSAAILKHPPYQLVTSRLNNDVRSLTLTIPLGRKMYWPKEGFPAVRRGDLEWQITGATTSGDLDTPTYDLDVMELPFAQPEQFLKYVSSTRVFTTTGEEDVPLPIGNPFIGILMFGTTVPTAALFDATWRDFHVRADNQEWYHHRTRWEAAQVDLAARVGSLTFDDGHSHQENLAAAYTQGDQTGPQPATARWLRQYAWLDFDPLEDDSYLMDTDGLADLLLRRFSGTADTGRVMPLELIKLGAGGGV